MLNYFIVISKIITENTFCSYYVFTIVTSTKVLIIKYNNVVKWLKAALYISHLGQSKLETMNFILRNGDLNLNLL